jgi:hypothetical protein
VDRSGISTIHIGGLKESSAPTLGKVSTAWNYVKFEENIIHTCPGEDNFKPNYDIGSIIRRKGWYYVVNIALPNLALAILGFSVYEMDTTEVASRISVSTTLLLTAIALKFSVVNLLPILCYQTALEKYCLVMIGFNFLMGLGSMIVGKMDPSDGRAVDAVVGYLLAIF